MIIVGISIFPASQHPPPSARSPQPIEQVSRHRRTTKSKKKKKEEEEEGAYSVNVDEDVDGQHGKRCGHHPDSARLWGGGSRGKKGVRLIEYGTPETEGLRTMGLCSTKPAGSIDDMGSLSSSLHDDDDDYILRSKKGICR